MTDISDHRAAARADAPPRRTSASLLAVAGAAGLFGCVALFLGNVIGSVVVDGHDWIADTVSDLAAGPHAWLQDVAIYAYAGGLIAAAMGSAHRHPGGGRWTTGALGLALLALTVVVIAAREAYSAGHEGVAVHIYLVYALGLLSAAVPFLMAKGLDAAGGRRGWAARAVGAFWIVGGPLFFYLPDWIDGLWERLLGLASIVFVTALSTAFLADARRISAP